jgi:hypothetical protein
VTDTGKAARSLFLAAFYTERAEYLGVRAADIRAGGKVSKTNPNKEDELWWLNNGPSMVQRWIDWRAESDWEIWVTPDGKPAIELELMPSWGGVPVKMFIDRVFVIPQTGALVVVDLKSGARSPDSELQLAWYAAGISSVYDVPVYLGAYWDARSGEMSGIKTLSRLTLPLLTFWVQKYVEARSAGIFLPNLTNMCRACGVNRYCAAYGGSKAEMDPDFARSQKFDVEHLPY